MSNGSLVSIFMPCYNAEKFLEEALNAALAQSYENIEIVVGDDCSTDRSVEIINNYAQHHPKKIRLLKNDFNLGPTRNFNKLLKHCHGDFVLFTAADDVLSPVCVEESLKLMQSMSNVGIVFHPSTRIDEFSKCLEQEETRHGSHSGGVELFLKNDFYLRTNGMLIRRSSIPEEGHDERLAVASDFNFVLRCLSTKGCDQFYYLNKTLSFYRKHPLSLTQSKKLEGLRDALFVIISLHFYSPKYAFYYKTRISEVFRRYRHSGIWSYRQAVFLAVLYNMFNFKAWIGLIFNLLTFGYAKR